MRVHRQDTPGPCWTCQGAGHDPGPWDGWFSARCWVCQGSGWLTADRIAVLGWNLPDAYYGL